MDGSGQQDLYNGYLAAWQRFARTFLDHAESIRFNLNRGGDVRRGTRTELKHVEDRQARAQGSRGEGVRQTTHAQLTRGGGETTLVRVAQGGRRHWRVHIFEFCRLFFSLKVNSRAHAEL